jgi:conjugative transfer signal peptidase TraF
MRTRLAFFAMGPLLGVFALFDVAGLRINTSASLPVGLYMVSSEGSFVEFCPDDRGLSAQRHYRGNGVCPDGATPLLKPVVGKPTDEIVLSPTGIAVDGKPLPHTAPLEHDSAGRSLAHFPFGHYRVAREALWVASSYNSRSYDSRYMGPIPQSAVRARLRAVIAW